MKLKHIIPILLLLPMLSACNQEDDVIEIFTGKTWRLNFIIDSKGDNCTDSYFTNVTDAIWKASMDKLSEGRNFTINFSGAEIDGDVIGTCDGWATTTAISGNWQANGKNNSFKITGQDGPGDNEDLLGKVFINALINAYKYEGDTAGNLTIYFEDKNLKAKRALVLFALKQ